MTISDALHSHAGPQWGLKWRSSVWFVTLVVTSSITTDLIIYSIVIPVFPFQLQRLGYTGVSSLVGWLLFAYSGGLVLSTPPIAWLSERVRSRQMPLILGLGALIASQVLLMESTAYWLMCVARVIQGVSSSIVWVVALALLCDTTPEAQIGQQMGIVMSGLSVGLLAGPPIGGALYDRFGYRAPFIFGIGISVVDLIGRLLIIEHPNTDSLRAPPHDLPPSSSDPEARPTLLHDSPPSQTMSVSQATLHADAQSPNRPGETRRSPKNASELPNIQETRPFMKAVANLARSPRALTALFITAMYGIAYASLEPTIPLRLQALYGLDAHQVGLVFIASVVPTLISSPLSGYLVDRLGTEWITPLCLLLSLPWWALLLVEWTLPFFTVVFGLTAFFTSAALSPVTVELAAVARELDHVGYGHVYGAFNIAYGIGSTIGPVLGGQLYDRLRHGWLAVCVFATAFMGVSTLFAFCYSGERPLLRRLIGRRVDVPIS
ncbi:hypothetical protein JAAARDRAFT_38007 [Jaapia argillacea MUCL 33604]|uniref:Major facilitator superfamily (MFS) profile domain-containing protein n=1 Tax=Jaapia argillacea MUCL 33604 TaxID=933084 RepID=A0A067PX32_9AGAM|nr:hypothetical protein JAAARDRAFT_38007 [Jaapia argillacea MUCL 33604]